MDRDTLTALIRPVTPKEVTPLAPERGPIPAGVIKVFNLLIAENLRGDFSTFTQDAVVERLAEAGYNIDEVFTKHWLDVESLYEEVGWGVLFRTNGLSPEPETFTFRRSHAYC